MIVLYSNHCPRCEVLFNKMNDKHLDFKVVDDVDVLVEKNFDFMPILEVDGKYLNFMEANNFINSFKG